MYIFAKRMVYSWLNTYQRFVHFNRGFNNSVFLTLYLRNQFFCRNSWSKSIISNIFLRKSNIPNIGATDCYLQDLDISRGTRKLTRASSYNTYNENFSGAVNVSNLIRKANMALHFFEVREHWTWRCPRRRDFDHNGCLLVQCMHSMDKWFHQDCTSVSLGPSHFFGFLQDSTFKNGLCISQRICLPVWNSHQHQIRQNKHGWGMTALNTPKKYNPSISSNSGRCCAHLSRPFGNLMVHISSQQ